MRGRNPYGCVSPAAPFSVPATAQSSGLMSANILMTSMFISNGRNLIKSLNTGQILSGLDLGDKTIGVAISDKNLIIGSPLKTILRKNTLKDIETLNNIFQDFNVGGIVLGLPLSLDGNEKLRTKKTREFGSKLYSSVRINIYLQLTYYLSSLLFKSKVHI